MVGGRGAERIQDQESSQKKELERRVEEQTLMLKFPAQRLPAGTHKG